MKREEFVAKMKQQIDDFNQKLNELEQRGADYNQEAREGFNSRINELKQKRDEAVAKFEEVDKAGEKAWEDLKTGATTAWNALQESLKQARSHLK
ncbi:MAG TPA: hypothetical protein VLT88_07625 [Desulfosarcina sp.]|nr:hypothetical protein [Desulfosarcina sp.]